MADNYTAGGYGAGNGDVGTLSDTWGRIKNNLNGTTAANQFTAAQNALTREFNSAEAAKQREWEQYMSNTAYQRQVEDLKAAGLNPAMAMSSSGGASTPSGYSASANAAGSVTPHTSGSIIGMIGNIAKTALSIALFKKFGHSAMAAKTAAGSVSATAKELQAAQYSFQDDMKRVLAYSAYAKSHSASQSKWTQDDIPKKFRVII